MKTEDAEEYTQSLGQIVSGSWRQIALAKRLGVPKALGLSTEQWVNGRLGGYVKQSIGERRDAVKELTDAGNSSREIGEILGVSHVTVADDVKKLTPDDITSAPPIDALAVLAVDDDMRAAAAAAEKRREKDARRDEKNRRKTTVPDDIPIPAERCQLIHAAVSEFGHLVAQESLDWIITDPPYPEEYLGVYAELAEFAARALKPNGSCLVMCGQSYLPNIIKSLCATMRYHWCSAYLTPGGQAVQIWPRKINTFWKPLLWFVKGEYAGDWVGDVTRSDVNDNDKRFHHWGQSESGMLDIVRRFTLPGQTICDPFLGGGTTAIAALATDRLFIGADINAAKISIAETRIRELLTA